MLVVGNRPPLDHRYLGYRHYFTDLDSTVAYLRDTFGNIKIISIEKPYLNFVVEPMFNPILPKPGNCVMTEDIRKTLINTLKERLESYNYYRDTLSKNSAYNKLSDLKLVFSYCDENNGLEITNEARDKLRKKIKAFLDTATTNKTLMVKPDSNFTSESVNDTDINTKKKEGYLVLAKSNQELPDEWNISIKYLKLNGGKSNINKINLYINNNEFREIPYEGNISDEYLKILFKKNSFEIFPIKKIEYNYN